MKKVDHPDAQAWMKQAQIDDITLKTEKSLENQSPL